MARQVQDQDQQDPWQGDMNPLDLDCILKLVLVNVGKHNIADLFRCRLVNHAWNRVAVEVLEQKQPHGHGYALELDFQKICRFEALLSAAITKQVSGPGVGELHPEPQPQLLQSLRLSLRHHLNSFHEGSSKVAKTSRLLLRYPHLRVGFINILYNTIQPLPPNVQANHELFQLFKLASNDLTAVKMCYGELDRRHFEEFNFQQYLSLDFPKLVSIDYEVANMSRETDGVMMLDMTRHIHSLITSNSSKLTKLILDVREGAAQQDRAVSSVRILIEACAATLEELHLEAGDGRLELSDALRDNVFPKLRLLRLNSFGLQLMTEELSLILEQRCPALVEIELSVDWRDGGGGGGAEGSRLNFPLLPRITRIGLYTTSQQHVFQLEPLEPPRRSRLRFPIFQRIMSKFPSLHMLSMDLEILAMFEQLTQYILSLHADQQRVALYEALHVAAFPIVFPNISTLEVVIGFPNTRMFSVTDRVLNLQLYQRAFPNVQQLLIKPDNELRGISAEMEVSDAIQFVSTLPRIRTLEIANCAQRWVELLMTNEDILEGLGGVESLRLLPRKVDRTSPQANLSELFRHFPALVHFQCGVEVLAGAELETVRDVLTRFGS